MTCYNCLSPPPPNFQYKKLIIQCIGWILIAALVECPPPPHLFPTWRRLFVSIWQCMFRFPTLSVFEESKTRLEKEIRLLSRINTYKTIDPIRQQLRSPYTHHPPPPKKDEIINMAYCTCACACAYGYLNWGVIWRGVYTVLMPQN